jgi:hypothetical protein
MTPFSNLEFLDYLKLELFVSCLSLSAHDLCISEYWAVGVPGFTLSTNACTMACASVVE